MKVSIKSIEDPAAEQVIIECTDVTNEIEEIRAFALSKGKGLTGYTEEQSAVRLSVEDIYYFEAVDEKAFAYTKNTVYEIKRRLYELEEAYKGCYFIRCSKSVVLNLMKLEGISPSLNGRFTAKMKNGEKLVISRKYASEIISRVMGK